MANPKLQSCFQTHKTIIRSMSQINTPYSERREETGSVQFTPPGKLNPLDEKWDRLLHIPIKEYGPNDEITRVYLLINDTKDFYFTYSQDNDGICSLQIQTFEYDITSSRIWGIEGHAFDWDRTTPDVPPQYYHYSSPPPPPRILDESRTTKSSSHSSLRDYLDECLPDYLPSYLDEYLPY